MATMPKHLRPRWRYLAVEIETTGDADLDQARMQEALWRASRTLLGDVGSADMDMSIVRWRSTHGRAEGIVRVHRGRVDPARAAIATIDRIDNTRAGVSVRGVSGTIRACEENYLGADWQAPQHELVTLGETEYEATVRADTVDLHMESATVGATTLDIS